MSHRNIDFVYKFYNSNKVQYNNALYVIERNLNYFIAVTNSRIVFPYKINKFHVTYEHKTF